VCDQLVKQAGGARIVGLPGQNAGHTDNEEIIDEYFDEMESQMQSGDTSIDVPGLINNLVEAVRQVGEEAVESDAEF